MKIIYTIAGLYRPAGMERILTDKANFLAGAGHDVTIVTTEQEGRPDAFPLHGNVKRADLGIGYERNNGGPFISKLAGLPLKRLRHKKRLKALLMKERPDVTVSMFCGDEGFLPRIKDGSRKVLEVHFSRFKRLQYGRKGLWSLADRFLSRRDGRIVRRFDRFVTLTREDLGYWGRPENGVCIPNFIGELPQEPSRLDSKTVLGVGRFCYQKGFDRLIEAWKIVKESPASEGWKLVLAGGGEDMESLQKLTDEEGLASSVDILGTRKETGSLYAASSIYALSSRYEGLPMVLLEAQGWGLPIVSFDCKCGPSDVVTDGKDGFLVKEGDVPALAEKLLELIGDGDLLSSMGKAARNNSSRWDKEKIMKQWTELFENI